MLGNEICPIFPSHFTLTKFARMNNVKKYKYLYEDGVRMKLLSTSFLLHCVVSLERSGKLTLRVGGKEYRAHKLNYESSATTYMC